MVITGKGARLVMIEEEPKTLEKTEMKESFTTLRHLREALNFWISYLREKERSKTDNDRRKYKVT